MSVMMPKFVDVKEAQKISVAVNLHGDALMGYLARAREQAVKSLLAARGEDIVRIQGAVEFADELIVKLNEARKTVDKMEQGGRR